MSLDALLLQLRADRAFMRDVVAWERVPARPGRYAPVTAALDSHLSEVLQAHGIDQLYTHQAAAVEGVLRGEHVCVVTSTASGKTLCYSLPVLNALLRDPQATALYLFPTKALANDQLASLSELLRDLRGPIAVQTYDGDTSRERRKAARQAGGIVITNPDMLHTGILPHHTQWAQLFQSLRYIVIDELHTYRGVFGSHFANVIRRLKRICRFYGSSPQFILASATIANPVDLAERLIEEPVTLVDDDGAPRGAKHFVVYNPPIVNRELGLRRSALLEAVRLGNDLLGEDVQTIFFARSRRSVELLLSYLQQSRPVERLLEPAGGAPVRAYRGGYLPTVRRDIERGLREGTVRGVVATNALELGVDIGQMGASVLVGYPGNI